MCLELGELLTISASSSDWTGVLAARRNEYSDAGGTTLVTFVNLGTGTLTTNPAPPGPGQLTGSVNNSSTAYNGSTVSMRLRIFDDDLVTSPTSTTAFSTVDNSGIDHFRVNTENSEFEQAGVSFAITVTARKSTYGKAPISLA